MHTPVRVYCDPLARAVELPERPQRIVSLVSSATESLFDLGCGDRVVGVSEYCGRYVAGLEAPVVGDYLRVDDEALRMAAPDLVITTSGIQRRLGCLLAEQGYPVYALPLPNSVYGILEATVTLGGLVGEVAAARRLCDRISEGLAGLKAQAGPSRPRVYMELWFGRHPRTPGGLTFTHDLIDAAGGANVLEDRCAAYLPLDLENVVRMRPDVMVVFSEPEHPVSPHTLMAERGWDRLLPGLRVIETGVTRGRNVIHDGPSILETAQWLHAQLYGG